MKNDGWLVKKDRLLAMRFFLDKFPDEDGSTYMRVHYASCKQKFLYGITPHVELHASEKMTHEIAGELWRSSLDNDWEVSYVPLWKTR